MVKTKKGKRKKGTKSKKQDVVDIQTTNYVSKEREKCICPRLGDIYDLSNSADKIKTDTAHYQIKKAIDRQEDNLNLKGCSLWFLPAELTKHESLASNIVHLNLSKNRLFNCERIFTDLSHLARLKSLDVSRNNLAGKLSEKVSAFTSLEHLYLDHNYILELHAACVNWKNLLVFSAAYNDLKSIPDQVGNWSSLEICNLSNNKLEIISEGISRWTEIKKLFLGKNNLREIPDAFNSMEGLIIVDLRGNLLNSLPCSLGQCRNIKYLNVGNNKITQLPSMMLWGELEDLQIYRNKINEIPGSIKMLRNLKRISSSNNKLKSLPDEIGTLLNLEELYLNYNSMLVSLPCSVGRLKSLKELQLRGCPKLKTLPSNLAKCSSLLELDLRTLAKKEYCKLQNELIETLIMNRCTIRGGIQKKQKKRGKGKKKLKS